MGSRKEGGDTEMLKGNKDKSRDPLKFRHGHQRPMPIAKRQNNFRKDFFLSKGVIVLSTEH